MVRCSIIQPGGMNNRDLKDIGARRAISFRWPIDPRAPGAADAC
jgi:hypothetical protein